MTSQPTPTWPARSGAPFLISLAPAWRGAMVFPPVPQPIRDLLDRLRTTPPGGEADERLTWLDSLAARLIAAVAPFCDEPRALLPAQRALLVLAGRRPGQQPELAGLSRALKDIDQQLGRDRGGFSRLLDAALSAGDAINVERIDAGAVDIDLRELALALEDLGRELLAIDDLCHALSAPAEIAAGAVILEGALDLAEGVDVAGHDELDALTAAWTSHRGIDAKLARVIALRAALERVDEPLVARASETGVAQPLAIWLLGHRVAAGQRLEDAPDRAAIEALLEAADLVPLEVFDAASLWRDLEGERR
jgi:hypothetical protein